MEKGLIPEIINSFHIYKGTGNETGLETEKAGEQFLGLSGEIVLPELNALTETISGSGILGEIEVGNPGHFSPIDMEIPFISVCNDMFQFSTTEYNTIILRMTQQSTVKLTRAKTYENMKVVVGGTMKSMKVGTVKIGGQMGSSVTLSVTYLVISVNGKEVLALDKINEVYRVNGKDQLEKIRKYS